MGAWGYEPFDNDSAMDWVETKLLAPVRKTLRSKRSRSEETLAALQVIIDLDLLHLFDEAELLSAFERVEAEHDSDSPAKRKKVLRKIKQKITL